jgi:hypothetical protein
MRFVGGLKFQPSAAGYYHLWLSGLAEGSTSRDGQNDERPEMMILRYQPAVGRVVQRLPTIRTFVFERIFIRVDRRNVKSLLA